MKQTPKTTIFTAGLALSLSLCGAFCSESSGHMADKNEQTSFTSLGATVYLPASGNTDRIASTVVDFDGDEQADGFDVSGNGIPELRFTVSEDPYPFGIDIDGNDLADFFLVVGDTKQSAVILNQQLSTSGHAITIVVDGSGLITGIDFSGDGQPDDLRLGELFSDTAAPYATSPMVSGEYKQIQTAVLYCVDNYACSHFSYSLSGPNGISEGRLPGASRTVQIGGDGMGEYRLTFSATDLAGNASAEEERTIVLNNAGLLITGVEGGLQTGEDGTSAQFEIALQSEPSENVTVQVAVSDSSEASIAGSNLLTFSPNNWDKAQTVTIQGMDDATPVRDGTGVYTVSLNPDGSDGYDLLDDIEIEGSNTDNERYFFATGAATTGSIGGVSGADDFCNNDSRVPDASLSYKALVAGGGRVATTNPGTDDGQSDWVLEPDTNYMRLDTTTLIFQSNSSALFDFGTWDATPEPDPGNQVWTGLSTDWTTMTGAHCDGWTDGSGGFQGRRAEWNQVSAQVISFGNASCNASFYLYCVEQP